MMWQALEPLCQAFCLWASVAMPVKLESTDGWRGVLLLLGQKLRSHTSAWKGKSGHQGSHKMYFSAFHFWGSQGVWPSCKPAHQETASVSPNWLDSLWERLWLQMMPRPNPCCRAFHHCWELVRSARSCATQCALAPCCLLASLRTQVASPSSLLVLGIVLALACLTVETHLLPGVLHPPPNLWMFTKLLSELGWWWFGSDLSAFIFLLGPWDLFTGHPIGRVWLGS